MKQKATEFVYFKRRNLCPYWMIGKKKINIYMKKQHFYLEIFELLGLSIKFADFIAFFEFE